MDEDDNGKCRLERVNVKLCNIHSARAYGTTYTLVSLRLLVSAWYQAHVARSACIGQRMYEAHVARSACIGQRMYEAHVGRSASVGQRSVRHTRWSISASVGQMALYHAILFEHHVSIREHDAAIPIFGRDL